MIKFLTLMLATFISAHASAQSCRDVDIRDAMTPELKEVFSTPFHQGSMGWCYAYSASDLLTARLGKQISPLHLSLVFSNSVSGLGATARNVMGLNKSGFYEAGTVPRAIELIQAQGHACSESTVTSQHEAYGLLPTFLESISDVYHGKADFLAQVNATTFLEKHFPGLPSEQVLAYIASRPAKTPAHSLLKVAQAACQGQGDSIEIPRGLKLATKNKSSYDQTSIVEFIDRGLNRKKPVSIRYTMKRLIDESQKKGFWMDNFSQHISTVIGRKKVGNQCMYVVRNSWGASCKGYAQGIFCNEREGTYQIPASELERATYAAEYIVN